MLAEERRIQLVEWSRAEGRIDANDAADRLQVAIETVRRDLDLLQRRGLLRRVHGGAIALDRIPHESSMRERRASNMDAKRRIADLAAAHIPTEGAIFVDGGTTTELLGEHLLGKSSLLVITNSIPLGNVVAESGTPVHLLSGRLRPTTLSALGSRTIADIDGFRAQLVFLGTNGVSAEMGLTTSDPEEAAVKQAMMRASLETIVLGDSTKFGSVFPAVIANVDRVDRFITDIDAPSASVQALVAHGVEVELA
jgi:DeoR family fructose operon transcriptional repressor